jgi:hypothetical protein
VQRLGAIQDEQHASGGVEAPVLGLGEQVPADRGVLGGALDHAERDLVAVLVNTQGADHPLVGEVEAVDVDDQPAAVGEVAVA